MDVFKVGDKMTNLEFLIDIWLGCCRWEKKTRLCIIGQQDSAFVNGVMCQRIIPGSSAHKGTATVLKDEQVSGVIVCTERRSDGRQGYARYSRSDVG